MTLNSPLRDLHPVPSLSLGVIERGIGEREESVGRGRDLDRAGDAAAHRDADRLRDGVGEHRLRHDGGADPLGESRRISLGSLIALLESEIGRKATVTGMPDQPGDVRTTWADVSLAEAELGYRPSVPIEEGIRRFVTWLKGRREEGGGLPA